MQIGDLVEVTAYCDNKHLHGKRGVVLASLDYDSYLVWLDGKSRVLRHYSLNKLS